MILGYMLLDEGGTLLYSEEIVPLIKEEKKAIFAGALSAISNIFKEVFKSKLKHVELENLHFYFGFSDNYVLVLVSDVEDESINNLVEDILRNIEAQQIDISMISMDLKLKERLTLIIKETIFASLFSIETIQKIAKMMIALIDASKGLKLGIKEVFPRKYKPGLLSRITRVFTKSTMEDVLNRFMEGKLEDVLSRALSLFETEYGELAAILYAKAGLILHSYDPKVPAPSLDELNTVIERIKADDIKSILAAELEAYHKLGGLGKIRDVFIKNQFSLSEKLADSGIPGDVYSIALTSINYLPLLEYLKFRFENKSEFILAQIEEQRYFTMLTSRSPTDINEWLVILGELNNKFIDAYKRKSPAAPYYFNILNFAFMWGLSNEKLPLEDALKLIKEYDERFERYREEMLDKMTFIRNQHKIHLLYLEYKLKLLLIEMNPDKNIKELEKMFNYIKEKLEWLLGLGVVNRIMQDAYYLGLSGLLSILSSLAFEMNTFISDVPQLISKLATKEVVKLKEYNEFQYGRFLSDLLISLGNTATFLQVDVLKRNILIQVAHSIEVLSGALTSKPIIHYYDLIQAIKFYLLSESPEGKEQAKKVLKKLELAPPLIRKIANEIYNKYNKER